MSKATTQWLDINMHVVAAAAAAAAALNIVCGVVGLSCAKRPDQNEEEEQSHTLDYITVLTATNLSFIMPY